MVASSRSHAGKVLVPVALEPLILPLEELDYGL
jgi:hypothetical protein